MPRQPLLTRYPNAGIAFGAGFLAERPKAAALIAECITGWTEVELQVARLLAQMLKANTEPTIALYLSLANERAKREALNSIADYVLSADDRTLFDAIFKAKNAIAAERNDLAHGLFGVVSDEPEGIGWISTKDRIKNIIHIERNKPNSLADYQQLKEFIFVYTIPDLERILDDISAIHRHVYQFVGYLALDLSAPSKTELYQRLWNDPLVLRFRSQTSENPGSAA